ncbi:MAG: hypothetical protein AAGF24_00060 [Cyanobacteria bacterium P01_H01_bin.121]
MRQLLNLFGYGVPGLVTAIVLLHLLIQFGNFLETAAIAAAVVIVGARLGGDYWSRRTSKN